MTLADDKVNFRYLFKDIVHGFSEVNFEGGVLYIKHLSSLDQVDLEELEEHFFNKAAKRGLPTEEETLTRLKEEEMWTVADITKLTEQEKYVESLQSARKQLFIKHEIDDNIKQTQKAQLKVVQLTAEKYDLIGQTSEKYAKSRVSDHYNRNSCNQPGPRNNIANTL